MERYYREIIYITQNYITLPEERQMTVDIK